MQLQIEHKFSKCFRGKPTIIESPGHNSEKQQIYGAVLSLYISRLVRQVNKKGMLKCRLVFDEFSTIYFNNMDSLNCYRKK